jgi:hypothetical protein
VERRKHWGAVVGRGRREVRAKLDELVGEDGLRLEGRNQGWVPMSPG